MPKTLRGSFEQALRPLPSVVKGVQACRLPGLKCLKRCAAASSRHSGHCPLLLRAFKPAVCQACKTLRSSFDQALRPLPSVVRGCLCLCLPACLCPGSQMPKTVCLPACLSVCRHCLPACLSVCPSVSVSVNGRSSLPFASPPPGLKRLKRCAAASSRHSGHCPLLLRAFKPAVCQASNA